MSEAPGIGRCVIAYADIAKGTVVCDYHAQLLDWQIGHQKYKANTSVSNTYMFAVQEGSNRFYLDATDEHCQCHPTTKLQGRLINHSVNGNLKPVVNACTTLAGYSRHSRTRRSDVQLQLRKAISLGPSAIATAKPIAPIRSGAGVGN